MQDIAQEQLPEQLFVENFELKEEAKMPQRNQTSQFFTEQIKSIPQPNEDINKEEMDNQSLGDSDAQVIGLKGLEDKRKQWLPEEDLLINIFVDKYGTKKWNIIADELKNRIPGSNRNGKQCRERWHNNLDHKIKKSGWNPNEEYVFMEAHKIHGNKWAEIANYIPGRTDNQIKNHFYSGLRKLISKLKKFEIPEKIFQDKQALIQTDYLVSYLQQICIKNNQNEKINLPEKQSKKEGNQEGKNGLAQFDVYLLNKLNENQVNIVTINQYKNKLKQIKKAVDSMEIKQKTSGVHQFGDIDCDQGSNGQFDSLNQLGKRMMDRSIVDKCKSNAYQLEHDANNSRHRQTCAYAHQERDDLSLSWNSGSNLNSLKKPYPTMPQNGPLLFKIEKDPTRLIEKEINQLNKSKQLKNHYQLGGQKNQLIISHDTEKMQQLMFEQIPAQSRMQSIIKKKLQLDQDHNAIVQQNEHNKVIIDLLQKVNPNDKIFADGILSEFIAKNNLPTVRKPQVKQIFQSVQILSNRPKINPQISNCNQQEKSNKPVKISIEMKNDLDSVQEIDQFLKNIPSRNQSVTIKDESLWLMKSYLESESISMSSIVADQLDQFEIKEEFSNQFIQNKPINPTIATKDNVNKLVLRKISKLTNKCESEKHDEVDTGFQAFRANSYNSHEHNVGIPMGENNVRRKSYMLSNSPINTKIDLLVKQGGQQSKQDIYQQSKSKSKKQAIDKNHSIQSSINRIQKTMVKQEPQNKDIKKDQRAWQQYLLNRRKSNSQHTAYKIGQIQKELLNIKQSQMRAQALQVNNEENVNGDAPSQSGIVQIECSNYYQNNNPFTAHSLYSSNIQATNTKLQENMQIYQFQNDQKSQRNYQVQRNQPQGQDQCQPSQFIHDTIQNSAQKKNQQITFPLQQNKNDIQRPDENGNGPIYKRQKLNLDMPHLPQPQPEGGTIFGQYNLNRTYNFKNQQDHAIQIQNQFIPNQHQHSKQLQVPINQFQINRKFQQIQPPNIEQLNLIQNMREAQRVNQQFNPSSINHQDDKELQNDMRLLMKQQMKKQESFKQSHISSDLKIPIIKNDQIHEEKKSNKRMKLPINELQYSLDLNNEPEIQADENDQNQSDIYKEIQSQFNLKNIAEVRNMNQHNEMIIREEFPSDITKSIVNPSSKTLEHIKVNIQSPENKQIVPQQNLNIKLQQMNNLRQGGIQNNYGSAIKGNETQLSQLQVSSSKLEMNGCNNFNIEKMLNQLFKAQEFLVSSVNTHKKQLRLLQENLQNIQLTKSALDRKNQDDLKQMLLEFKAQQKQVQNIIGQSELYHIKIEQQLLKLKQMHLEQSIQIKNTEQKENEQQQSHVIESSCELQRNSVINQFNGVMFLAGDTGGNLNDKKYQQSDLNGRSNNVLPSISEIIDNISKSRHEDVLKEDSYDGMEKQTLYQFLSENHSHNHIEVVCHNVGSDRGNRLINNQINNQAAQFSSSQNLLRVKTSKQEQTLQVNNFVNQQPLKLPAQTQLQNLRNFSNSTHIQRNMLQQTNLKNNRHFQSMSDKTESNKQQQNKKY